MNGLIEAIKEFFFDIIGFLLPGFMALFIAKVVFSVPINFEGSNAMVNIFVAYSLGYLIFALSQIKDSCIKVIANWTWIPKKVRPISENQIISDLLIDDTYLLASEIISKKLNKSTSPIIEYKSFRNIAMSSSPEADKKIYTFMFRAELFNHLHTISIIVLTFLILIFLLSLVSQQTMIITVDSVIFCWILLFFTSMLVLRKGWKRFYKIAMNLPFPIYIEKNKNYE